MWQTPSHSRTRWPHFLTDYVYYRKSPSINTSLSCRQIMSSCPMLEVIVRTTAGGWRLPSWSALEIGFSAVNSSVAGTETLFISRQY